VILIGLERENAEIGKYGGFQEINKTWSNKRPIKIIMIKLATVNFGRYAADLLYSTRC
jgi:hypothetical protein